MKTAILSVGTELLFGQITNTNSVYLSQELNLLGYDVMYHHTVGDNPKRLKEAIEHIFKDCDLIITTGGLGPTQDDLTKEIACETLSDKMVLDPESLEALKQHFDKFGRKMTENNLKQAYFPSRAVIFDNDQGTAPGFALENEGKIIICMPGPPREMTNMFVKKIKPFLESKKDGVIYYRIIRTFGIGESQLETSLLNLINRQSDPTLATYAKEGESTLRIASKRSTLEEAKAAVDEMIDEVNDVIGQYIYSCDDETLPQVVCKKLIGKGITVSCAESCTGGAFASELTSIAGISSVFDRGLVTYSNKAKMEELGISEATLNAYGAVSAETAREMVEGLKRITGSKLCVSVTGIIGPDGGSEEKPVGTAFIGVLYGDKVVVRRIKGRKVNRKWNKNYSVLAMFDTVNKVIDGKESDFDIYC